MPRSCGVYGCKSRASRTQKSFFRLPAEIKKGPELKVKLSYLRRKKWIIAIRRSDLTETKKKYLWICEDHFLSGKPSGIFDLDNPDWVPSLNMGYKCKPKDSPNLQISLNSLKNITLEELIEKTNPDSSKCVPQEAIISDTTPEKTVENEYVKNLVNFCFNCTDQIAAFKEVD